jgi:hypothetical protein
LKKAREVALTESFKAGNSYKEAHDKKASEHNLKEGDCLFGQSTFSGKKIKNYHNTGLALI